MNPPLTAAYLDIADRAVAAADVTLNNGLHEKACFLTYIAFESTGGALASSLGRTYPSGHTQKVNQFTALAQRRSYGLAVAQLAIALSSERNRSLYPSIQGDGTVTPPQQVIGRSFTSNTLGRVRGILRQVRRDV